LKTPGRPANEAARLDALAATGVLDTPPEEDLDGLTRLAADILGVPIALISIVDAERQWFKSRYGLDVPETPRDVSFCGHVVAEGEALVVRDALCDERFADNPLVTGEPRVRFYAGVPLRLDDGHVLGTLCAIDHTPRELEPGQRRQLATLARQVVAHLELRRERRRLAEVETRLETHHRFFDLSLDLLCTATPDTRFDDLNPAWEATLGWTLDELRARSFLDLVHPDDRENTLREGRSLFQESASTTGFENRYRHKDGRWVPLSWVATAQDGVLYATARDMTAYRDKESALVASESRVRALFAGMAEGMVVQAGDGRIVGFNPAAERILGLTKSQLVGLTSVDPRWRAVRADGTDLPGEEHPAMVTLRTRQPTRDFVMGVDRPDGSRVWLLVSSHLTDDPSDSQRVAVTTFRDVTRQREIEQALAFERALLGAVLDGLPQASVVLYGGDLSVERAFGALGARLDGGFLGWIPEDQHARIRAAAIACWDGVEGRVDVSVEGRRYEIGFVPLRDDLGAVAHGLAMIYDVTERTELRERLARQERLVTTGTLAAGVGHEINNPLSFVLSNLQFAVEELGLIAGGSPSGRVKAIVEVLEEATEGAQRIRKIVHGLRAFARDGGSIGPTDVHGALQLSVNMSMHELRLKAHLRSELAPVPLVLADDARLAQVFVNLLVNAAQAFPEADPERNEIVVRTRTGEHSMVVVEIADNGPGIDPDVAPRIFDPFFTTKPIGVGTGLGLSISNSIITSLGGEITVDTSPKGTTFRIHLPMAGQRSLVVGGSRTPALEGGGRVLVVDDEQGMLRSIDRLLRQKHTVTTEHDPRAALARIQRGERFDVVLCDITMPHLSGAELLREVEELAPELARRFVFITGGVVDEAGRRFLEDSPHERIDKPFSPQDLRSLVSRYVERGPET